MSLLSNAETSRMGGPSSHNLQAAFKPMTKAELRKAQTRAEWLKTVRANARY